jgi:Transglycosylase SLT domain
MTALAWGAKVSAQFRQRVAAICAGLGFDPSWLMACMQFESGLDPAKRNPASGATGLIQFMPSTASGLGTSVDALAAMSAEQQLEYVGNYFAPFKGKIQTFADCYMAILWPKAVGAMDVYIIFGGGSAAYEQNKALDIGSKGYVTKGDAASFPLKRLTEGLLPENAAELEAPAPKPDPKPQPQNAPPITPEANPMGTATVFALLSVLQQFVPQIAAAATALKPGSASTAKDVATAQTIFNAVTQAAGIVATPAPGAAAPNATAADVGAAIDKMSADPTLVKTVQQAVVTHPDILPVLEIGAGGIQAARTANVAAVPADGKFWQALCTPVFVVSVLFAAIIIMIVGNMLGMPWGGNYSAWSENTRSNVIFAVVAGVLGALTGYYFGTTGQSAKKDQTIAAQAGVSGPETT